MLNRIQAWPAPKKIIAAIISILIIFLVVLPISLLPKKTDVVDSQNPVIKFEYCESDPKDLCVLSFERGGPQNSFINFLAAERKFPDFYLIVKNEGVESRYECARSIKIKTNVACSGAPLSLKQTIEVTIFSSKDDRLLATGVFFIEAFLVSAADSQPIQTITSELRSSPTSRPTVHPTAETSTAETSTAETPTIENSITATPDL